MSLLRPWPRDPRYSVGLDGTIYGVTGKPMNPAVQHGIPGVTTTTGGRFHRVKVSVIVCETFHGPRPPGMHAAHENGDSLDNRPENLSWKTAKENEADKIRHGTSMQGVRHHQAKLTEEDVREIREKRAQGRLLWDLAAVYGVTESTISSIANRKTWSQI